jgi:hypothetical protein
VQVSNTAPQTSLGLLAVGPDMAKVSVVVALCKASLYIDDDMVKVINLNILVKVTRNRGSVFTWVFHWILFEHCATLLM